MVVSKRSKLSYRELNERANRLAHHLRRLGVGPETPVGVLMERSMEMVVALLGSAESGRGLCAAGPGVPGGATVVHARGCAGSAVLLTQAAVGGAAGGQ